MQPLDVSRLSRHEPSPVEVPVVVPVAVPAVATGPHPVPRLEPDLPPLVGDRWHVPLGPALVSLARCVGRAVVMMAGRKLVHPSGHLGDVIRFGDGSHARVYRETLVDRTTVEEPVVLVVGFRLRGVRGAGHALFRAESPLNTPLFVGFPGFVSKLWLDHDEHGVYRGVYQWDGAAQAHAYARALWWVLALVSVRSSIRYAVVREHRRDDLLAAGRADDDGELDPRAWWCPTGASGPLPRA